jgi:hypothetical protein
MISHEARYSTCTRNRCHCTPAIYNRIVSKYFNVSGLDYSRHLLPLALCNDALYMSSTARLMSTSCS